MSLNINFHWESKSHLLEKDASLSLGWIEIKTPDDNDISLFKKKLSMLFISVSDLMDFLSSNLSTFKWIGADSGELYLLKKKEGVLFISNNHEEIQINLLEFNKELTTVANQLINFVTSHNENIQVEGAFIDLVNSLKQLNK